MAKKCTCIECDHFTKIYKKTPDGKYAELPYLGVCDRLSCEDMAQPTGTTVKACDFFEPKRTAIYLTREELNEWQRMITQCKKALAV